MASFFQFDGAEIARALESEDWETDYMDDYYEICAVFLGTIMGLTPSGKVYYPFACSNVEVCEACSNAFDLPCDDSNPCNLESGEHCEACQDAQWWQSPVNMR